MGGFLEKYLYRIREKSNFRFSAFPFLLRILHIAPSSVPIWINGRGRELLCSVGCDMGTNPLD